MPGGEGRLGLALDGSVDGWQRGVKDYAAAGPTILRLVEAIVTRRRCKVGYRAPGRPEAKRFPYDPYRILSVQGGLYVVGKVPAYSNLATLAIDRIEALELLEERRSRSTRRSTRSATRRRRSGSCGRSRSPWSSGSGPTRRRT